LERPIDRPRVFLFQAVVKPVVVGAFGTENETAPLGRTLQRMWSELDSMSDLIERVPLHPRARATCRLRSVAGATLKLLHRSNGSAARLLLPAARLS
jgi:hypothetical protein